MQLTKTGPFLALAIAALAATTQPSEADDSFPNRPIKIIVPVSPGGAPDVVARLVADRLGPKLGQPVLVEDRPGAGERIGAEFVAKAEPDGYTLLAAPPASLIITPFLFSHLAYDPKAFVPVTVLTSGHLVLVTSPALPAVVDGQVGALVWRRAWARRCIERTLQACGPNDTNEPKLPS